MNINLWANRPTGHNIKFAQQLSYFTTESASSCLLISLELFNLAATAKKPISVQLKNSEDFEKFLIVCSKFGLSGEAAS